MADKPAIRALAVRRLTEKTLRTLTFADVVAAFQAATPDARQNFASAIYGSQPGELQRTISIVMRPYVEGVAGGIVDAALADDNLTLDELENILL